MPPLFQLRELGKKHPSSDTGNLSALKIDLWRPNNAKLLTGRLTDVKSNVYMRESSKMPGVWWCYIFWNSGFEAREHIGFEVRSEISFDTKLRWRPSFGQEQKIRRFLFQGRRRCYYPFIWRTLSPLWSPPFDMIWGVICLISKVTIFWKGRQFGVGLGQKQVNRSKH